MLEVDYEKPTESELLHIYVEVAQGRGQHGDFLKNFAQAYIRADTQNRMVLDEVARILAIKYKLADYLDTLEKV